MAARNSRFILIALVLAVTRPAMAANFTMDSWSLGVGIFPSSATPTRAFFTQVMDPFGDSHNVNVGASSVSGTYDFWPSQGEFLISGAIEADAEDNTTLITCMSGALLITTQSDVVLHYDADWRITLPVPTMISALSVRVIDPDAQVVLLTESRSHDTLFNIGTRQLTFSGDLLLPAGRRYYIGYYLDVTPLSSSSGHFGVAAGSFNFLLTPEPATWAICVGPITLLLRRGRRS